MTRAELAALNGGWPAVVCWALPRIAAGTFAVAVILLALALLIPGA